VGRGAKAVRTSGHAGRRTPAVLRCPLGNEASPAGALAEPHGADGFCVGRRAARLVWKVATMPVLLDCLAVCAGGALGSLARYFISLAPFKSVGDAGFPLATLLTNVVGAFVIGLIVATVAAGHELDSRLVLFLKVGVCGGFTTFSTFALESVGLVQRGEPLVAVVYVMLSAGLGMGAVLLAQQSIG
jgi:CrcB protein